MYVKNLGDKVTKILDKLIDQGTINRQWRAWHAKKIWIVEKNWPGKTYKIAGGCTTATTNERERQFLFRQQIEKWAAIRSAQQNQVSNIKSSKKKSLDKRNSVQIRNNQPTKLNKIIIPPDPKPKK